MKKGFTLIELLAVIVILAIIALIVTPVILNIINNAQEGADKRSIEQYAKIVKEDYLERKLSDPSLTLDDYLINFASETTYDGDKIKCDEYKAVNNEIELKNCTVGGRGYYNYVNGEVTKGDTVENTNTNNDETNNTDNEDNNQTEEQTNQFAIDSWSTVIANEKNGNTSAYNVGDEKEITLTGFTNTENENGTYTVRIANTSTPSECSTEGFSQTACGFVIEFVDIITEYNMNSSSTNVGGWNASAMRTYVNDTIYNSLPEEIRNSIIDTTVVSGHGSTSGESNFTTEEDPDKLYLLSTKEVWGKEGTSNVINYDTAEAETRQLDYYKSIGVTTSNYSGAIKEYNRRAAPWWLRSAYSGTLSFYYVRKYGYWHYYAAYSDYGVAVAFRI